MADPLDTAGEGAGNPPARAGEREGTASVREAARYLGVSERTIRRRIQDEHLAAIKHETEYGYEWRIPLAALEAQGDGVLPRHADGLPGTYVQGGSVDTRQVIDELGHALEVVEEVRRAQREELERLRRETQQLAGQVGCLQARVQEQERQIALLMAPQDPEPAAPSAQTQASADARNAPELAPRRSLWARVVWRLAGEP